MCGQITRAVRIKQGVARRPAHDRLAACGWRLAAGGLRPTTDNRPATGGSRLAEGQQQAGGFGRWAICPLPPNVRFTFCPAAGRGVYLEAMLYYLLATIYALCCLL